MSEATLVGPGIGLPGQAMATGQPWWVSDLTADAASPRVAAAGHLGVRAGFAFPVLAGTEVVAVLEFFSNQSAERDEGLLEVMAQVGTQLGRVVERERSSEELARVRDAAMEASRLKSEFWPT